MEKKFIPFAAIPKFAAAGVLVVDSFHPKGFTLSHWKGAPKLSYLHADTSTGIVLNAIQADVPEIHSHPYVTNNHFDIDGFLGTWSLFYPQLAIAHNSLLRKMALLGDFREIELKSEEDYLALKLVCWLNKVETDQFYAPFASYTPGQSEVELCVPKFEYFIPRFEAVLNHIEDYKQDWETEYKRVLQDWAILHNPYSSISQLADIRMLVIATEEPLHYYSLFGHSGDSDLVLCLYNENRYELEYKYTGWVDTLRPSYPRINLQPLAKRLNQLEEGEFRWAAEKLTDTGPILRLKGENLSKEQRYDHPYKRTIYSSSIAPDIFKAEIIAYFRNHLTGLQKKGDWSWEEVRTINQRIFN